MNKKLFGSLLLSLFLCTTQLVAGTLSAFYKTQVVHEQHSTPSMGLQEWSQSSMAQVIDDMMIFSKEAKLGILKAQSNSLYRKLGIIERLCPHIAVARVLYEQKGNFVSCPLNAIFSSTIAHRKSDRFDEKYRNAMEDLLYGIAPYEGSPCRFAHSERAVGIYLLENLKGIVKNKKAECVVIQIKTSLVPCDDCKKFWMEEIHIGKSTKGKSYTDFACSSNDKILQDWLKNLKETAGITGKLGVSINCSATVNDEDEIMWSAPVERII